MIILVIAAHPDDEVLGCGGMMAKLSTNNAVHTLIMGEGLTSRRPNRSDTDSKLIDKLTQDAKNSAKVLGTESISFLNLPDNRFDEVSLLSIVKSVEKHIDLIKPDTIYTHQPGDLNIDHQITFRAVLTATRPLKSTSVKNLYSFEIPSSTEWSFNQLGHVFNPNMFYDITDTLETKLEALECYSDEMREYPHPRSMKAIKSIASRWGSVSGSDYAEAFQLIRSVQN